MQQTTELIPSKIYYIVSEIIATEFSNIDAIIRTYKTSLELLADIEIYVDQKKYHNERLTELVRYLKELLSVYESIYQITGDSGEVFRCELSVPMATDILKLNSTFPSMDKSPFELLQTIREKQLSNLKGEKEIKRILPLVTNELSKKDKVLILSYSLANLICCKQFFALNDLRKKGQIEYDDFFSAFEEIVNLLPPEFHNAVDHRYQIDGKGQGIYADAGAIIQRLSKYPLLVKELLVELFKEKDKDKEKEITELLVERHLLSIAKGQPEQSPIKFEEGQPEQYLLNIANILFQITGHFADATNKSAHLKEKADPTQAAQIHSEYGLLVAYQQSVLADFDFITLNKSINNANKKVLMAKNSKTPMSKEKEKLIATLVANLQEAIAVRDRQQELRQELLEILNKKIAALYTHDLLKVKSIIDLLATLPPIANQMIESIYKELELPIIDFNRTLSKRNPYIPISTIDINKFKSPPTSPRNAVTRLRAMTEAVLPEINGKLKNKSKSFRDRSTTTITRQAPSAGTPIVEKRRIPIPNKPLPSPTHKKNKPLPNIPEKLNHQPEAILSEKEVIQKSYKTFTPAQPRGKQVAVQVEAFEKWAIEGKHLSQKIEINIDELNRLMESERLIELEKAAKNGSIPDKAKNESVPDKAKAANIFSPSNPRRIYPGSPLATSSPLSPIQARRPLPERPQPATQHKYKESPKINKY